MAKEGKLSLLIKDLLEHPGHEHVQAAACEALAGLTARDDNQRVKVAAEGGVGAIVGAMQRQSSAKVQAAACQALNNLARNDANKVRIAAEGGVGAIVKALQSHPTHTKIQEAGCRALWYLTYNNTDNRVQVAAEGGVGAIVAAMDRHPADAKVQEAACGALRNLRAMALQDATGGHGVASAKVPAAHLLARHLDDVEAHEYLAVKNV